MFRYFDQIMMNLNFVTWKIELLKKKFKQKAENTAVVNVSDIISMTCNWHLSVKSLQVRIRTTF